MLCAGIEWIFGLSNDGTRIFDGDLTEEAGSQAQ
jgi:hypothetical protein